MHTNKWSISLAKRIHEHSARKLGNRPCSVHIKAQFQNEIFREIFKAKLTCIRLDLFPRCMSASVVMDMTGYLLWWGTPFREFVNIRRTIPYTLAVHHATAAI